MKPIRFLQVAEAGKLVKKAVIRDGRRQIITVREYPDECKDGYKRDHETGRCVKMSLEEIRHRSIAATKAANKSSTKRNRAISIRRRKSLIR